MKFLGINFKKDPQGLDLNVENLLVNRDIATFARAQFVTREEVGAEGEIRTHTGFTPTVFESHFMGSPGFVVVRIK